MFLLVFLIVFMQQYCMANTSKKSVYFNIRQEGFADIVEKISPAIVYIRDGTPKNNTKNIEYLEIPFNFEKQNIKHGSGFLVSSNGFILTNKHVIDKMVDIVVTLNDNRQFNAEIIGVDPIEDLALLKILGDNLGHLTLGNSDEVRLGNWAIAVGCPFVNRPIVTLGIVSGVGLAMGSMANYDKYIQTDALLPPGNSGGPLLNIRGEVIGMNSAALVNGKNSRGMGFIITSKTIKQSRLLKHFPIILD